MTVQRMRKLLRAYVSEHHVEGGFDSDHDAERRTNELFEQMRQSQVQHQPSLKAIPRFYRDVHPQTPSRQLLRTMARRLFLQQKTEDLVLTEEELAQIATLLTEHATPPHSDQHDRISYQDFIKVGKLVSSRSARFFTSWVFFLLPRDEHFRIGTHLLFHYICSCMTKWQTRIQLSVYDTTGCGYLREQDLENYIYALIPSFPSLNDLQDNFFPYYVFTAVRKFFFFLDPKRTGRILLKTLMNSTVLEELLQLQQHQGYDSEIEVSNWFSASNALRVYTQYLELDRDHNGMLSKSELAMFGRGSLTDLIIDRIFEECHTYDGEMDYKTFLDFILAMENKQTPQGAGYFFRLLDVKCVGYLDIFTINCFFREIVKRLCDEDGDVVNVEDVKDEIFDMCTPKHPYRITLEDLLNCQMADTVITMLTDLSGFWAYDNRETLIAEEYMEQDDIQYEQQMVGTQEYDVMTMQQDEYREHVDRAGTPMPGDDEFDRAGTPMPGEDEFNRAGTPMPGDDEFNRAGTPMPGDDEFDRAGTPMPGEDEFNRAGTPMPGDDEFDRAGTPMPGDEGRAGTPMPGDEGRAGTPMPGDEGRAGTPMPGDEGRAGTPMPGDEGRAGTPMPGDGEFDRADTPMSSEDISSEVDSQSNSRKGERVDERSLQFLRLNMEHQET